MLKDVKEETGDKKYLCWENARRKIVGTTVPNMSMKKFIERKNNCE